MNAVANIVVDTGVHIEVDTVVNTIANIAVNTVANTVVNTVVETTIKAVINTGVNTVVRRLSLCLLQVEKEFRSRWLRTTAGSSGQGVQGLRFGDGDFWVRV